MAFDYKVISGRPIHKLNWIREKWLRINGMRTHSTHTHTHTLAAPAQIYDFLCLKARERREKFDAWRIWFFISSFRRSPHNECVCGYVCGSVCVRQNVDFSTAKTTNRYIENEILLNSFRLNENETPMNDDFGKQSAARKISAIYLRRSLFGSLFLASKPFILFALRNSVWSFLSAVVLFLSFVHFFFSLSFGRKQCVIDGIRRNSGPVPVSARTNSLKIEITVWRRANTHQ